VFPGRLCALRAIASWKASVSDKALEEGWPVKASESALTNPKQLI
jgi:hypothetical protein